MTVHVKQMSTQLETSLRVTSKPAPQTQTWIQSMSIVPTVRVGGVGFSSVTMRQTLSMILLMIQKSQQPHHIVTGNLDHLCILETDREFRDAYASASLVLADGMPVVWLSKLIRSQNQPALPERVSGSDLFWELGKLSQTNGVRIFLLGGKPGAADGAKAKLIETYPDCEICGTYCPSFEDFESTEVQNEIVRQVRSASPDVLMVAFGAPKQEKWIMANKHRLGVPVSIGVGGSFEMACGFAKRAPKIMQELGLEWAFRLLQDPARLYERYILKDMPFLIKLLRRTIVETIARTH
jgi:N-acetylglucosaminyldiphosphoundecaprenol N-acetyl-beta-D-mannosaminyltransferase